MAETISASTSAPLPSAPPPQQSNAPQTGGVTGSTLVNETSAAGTRVKASHTEQNNATIEGMLQSFPVLPPPKTELTPDSIELVLAFVTQTLNEANASQLKFQQQLGQGVTANHLANLNQARDMLETAQKNLQDWLEDLQNKKHALEGATKDLSAANAQLAAEQSELTSAQENFDRLKQSADRSNDFQSQLQLAESALQTSQQRVSQAQTAQSSSEAEYAVTRDAALTSQEAALSAQSTLVAANEEALQLGENNPALLLNSTNIGEEMTALMELIAELTQMINDAERTKMENSTNLSRELQAQRLEQSKEAARKYRADVEDAKQKNARASLANKILGGFLAVFGAVASLGSGPVGMAIAAIGVGMFVADTAMEACGVQSITSRWMTPIQEHVITPLTKAVAEEMVSASGGELSEKDAEIIAGVIVGIAVAGAMIAVTVVAHNNLSGIKLPMSQFNTQINNAVAAALEKMALSPVTFRVGMQISSGVVSMLNTSIQTTMRIQSAQMEAEGAQTLADLNKLQNDQTLLQTLQSQWIKSFCENTMVRDLWNSMSAAIQNLSTTSIRIASGSNRVG